MKHWIYCVRCHIWHNLEYTSAGFKCPTCGIEFKVHATLSLKNGGETDEEIETLPVLRRDSDCGA